LNIPEIKMTTAKRNDVKTKLYKWPGVYFSLLKQRPTIYANSEPDTQTIQNFISHTTNNGLQHKFCLLIKQISPRAKGATIGV
jgi:hypothetical protein